MSDILPQLETELPAGESVEVETPQQESSPSIEQTMSKAYDESVTKQEQRDEKRREIIRSAKGQFSRKATADQSAVQPPSVSPETAAPAVRQAPTSLPAALRAEWDKIIAASPQFADHYAKRETEAHQKITELGQIAKSSDAFRQIGEKYAGALKGHQPAQAFEMWAAASDFLDRNPVEGIRWLAQSYGLDLRQLAGEAPVAMHDPGALQTNEALIRDFASSRQEYWPQIENEVLAQVNAIRATDPDLPPQIVLERAYDRALKLNDGVQAKIQAGTKAEAEKKAKAEAAKRAAEAKKAASINVRSTQGAAPKARGNWENTMREVADRIMGN